MEQVIIGILLALVGLGVCFFGLRYWFILLPIFGAITGFFIGARVVQEVFGTGFLSTGVSWIVGIIVGLVFALLSWFVWYAGAIIMAGAVGASLFSGILHAIFTNPWGIALFIVALIGAVLFAELLLGVGIIGAGSTTVAGLNAHGAQVMAIDNTRAIGRVLYTQYFYLFQVAGLVLLVAMIGAIVLTLRSRPGVRRQKAVDQINRTKEQSVTVVKVPTRGGV